MDCVRGRAGAEDNSAARVEHRRCSAGVGRLARLVGIGDRDGRIIIATWPNISLLRVPADGGTPEVVTRPSDKAWFMWPTPAGDQDRAVHHVAGWTSRNRRGFPRHRRTPDDHHVWKSPAVRCGGTSRVFVGRPAARRVVRPRAARNTRQCQSRDRRSRDRSPVGCLRCLVDRHADLCGRVGAGSGRLGRSPRTNTAADEAGSARPAAGAVARRHIFRRSTMPGRDSRGTSGSAASASNP